eukprot:scaffold37613_cov67-Phaeocystis_antarctica.AAC.1
MHTVTCVRTLSIGLRRHGPRLCMLRPRAAKVALRRSPARERRCSARRAPFAEQKAPFLLYGGKQATLTLCHLAGLHPPAAPSSAVHTF